MRFPMFARFYDHENPPGVLPPATPQPREEPEPARSRGYIECDGCGCRLDSRGQVLVRGDGLKAHIEREDEVFRLKKELDTAHERITELESQVAALTPKSAPRRSILM